MLSSVVAPVARIVVTIDSRPVTNSSAAEHCTARPNEAAPLNPLVISLNDICQNLSYHFCSWWFLLPFLSDRVAADITQARIVAAHLRTVCEYRNENVSMIRKQSLAIATVSCLALAFAPSARADPVNDACAALVKARSALYSLINAKDTSTQDELRKKLEQATDKLDSLLAAMINSDAKTAAEFKKVWDLFKATRDHEIITAIESGDVESAKKIADTVQLRRLSKMWNIMSCK